MSNSTQDPPRSPPTVANSVLAPAGQLDAAPMLRPRVAWARLPWERARRALAAAALVCGISAIPYPRYVTEPCRVLPAKRWEVRARTAGILAEIQADEGSRVQAGQMVARLEDQDLESALHRARAEEERLAAVLTKLRAGTRTEEIARARALLKAKRSALSFAQGLLQRESALFAERLVSNEERFRSLADEAEKKGDVALADAELRLLQAGYRSEEIESGRAELKRAELEVADLERRRALLEIAAPIAGTLITPRFRERLHERIGAGGTVFELADLNRARIEIFVPEREFDVLSLGQPTTVKVQSFPLQPFKGKVDFIAFAVEERDGERVIRVVTEVENAAGLLRESMTGYGEIDTGKTKLISLALRRVVRWVRIRFLI